MAVTYVYNKETDESLVKYIKTNLPKDIKNINVKIYITDEFQDLEIISKDKIKYKILITENCEACFIQKAVDTTKHLIYKHADLSYVVERILNILKDAI